MSHSHIAASFSLIAGLLWWWWRPACRNVFRPRALLSSKTFDPESEEGPCRAWETRCLRDNLVAVHFHDGGRIGIPKPFLIFCYWDSVRPIYFQRALGQGHPFLFFTRRWRGRLQKIRSLSIRFGELLLHLHSRGLHNYASPSPT